jgi:alpha-mannosidase
MEPDAARRGTNPLPASTSFFSIAPELLEVVAFKRAEDGRGVIVRLQEPHGLRGVARITTSLSFTKCTRTDLVERDLAAPEKIPAGSLEVAFRPGEILTLRFL